MLDLLRVWHVTCMFVVRFWFLSGWTVRSLDKSLFGKNLLFPRGVFSFGWRRSVRVCWLGSCRLFIVFKHLFAYFSNEWWLPSVAPLADDSCQTDSGRGVRQCSAFRMSPLFDTFFHCLILVVRRTINIKHWCMCVFCLIVGFSFLQVWLGVNSFWFQCMARWASLWGWENVLRCPQ